MGAPPEFRAAANLDVPVNACANRWYASRRNAERRQLFKRAYLRGSQPLARADRFTMFFLGNIHDVDVYAPAKSSSKLPQCFERGKMKTGFKARDRRNARAHSLSKRLLGKPRPCAMQDHEIGDTKGHLVLLFAPCIKRIGPTPTGRSRPSLLSEGAD